MWPDDDGAWSAVVTENPAVTISESSWGLKDVVDLAKNVFGAAAQVDQFFYNREAQQVQLQGARNALNTGAYVTGIQGQIAMRQADAQLAVAQNQVRTAAGVYGADQLATIAGNFQRQLAGMTGGNSLMLWLTVAGVGLAFMQFVKK